ncbi:MAG: sugar transferase [Candidatus Sericytochromatia bacterium]|nr:sugar transferase [Candidatus Tanganyikabacteria bacterium]
MVPNILRAPVPGQVWPARSRRGPGLLALSGPGDPDRAAIALCGRMDASCGPVLAEAFAEAALGRPAAAKLDLAGVRAWNALGVARLLEAGAGFGDVTVVGAADSRLAAALRDARPDWEVLAPDGLPVSRPAHDWPRHAADAAGQCLDVAIAAFALLALLPLLACIAVWIKLDSPGSVLYTQLRAGRMRRDGTIHVVRVFKFRTMRSDADALRAGLMAAAAGSGPFFKLKEDPRVTRVGRILRATSLDELPQLLNILLGEMRLVGNRPLALDEAAGLVEPWHRVRFHAPAGLTGLWQVSGRNEASDLARLALDSAYAAARTPFLDLRIILATVPAVLLRKGW